MDINSAVVLAAGEGRRLRPLTEFRPKPMLPAGNEPILERVLDALIDAGIDDLHVIVGYQRDRVQNYFGPTYRDRTISYHHQAKQLGSGHALLQAREAIDADFLVVNGDEVVATRMIRDVIHAHARENVATLAVVESEDAPEYGAVELDDDRVTALVEKPDDDAYSLLNAGVYAFGPSIFTEIEGTPQTDGERGLTDTIARLIGRGGNVHGVRTAGPRTEATYPWDLLELSSTVFAADLVAESEIDEGVYVAASATVHADATLQPPVVVGPDSIVGPGAVVGPTVALGRNVTVAAGSVVDRSVVDADTRIGPNATLSDVVTGTGVTVHGNVTVPGGPANVAISTTIHEDVQLGCVMADRATIGGGSTIHPGTLVGPDAEIGHGCFVRDDVPADAEVRR
jgi:glucose-1-phosphate thymidylyltransferase